jgi:hypothetical protein
MTGPVCRRGCASAQVLVAGGYLALLGTSGAWLEVLALV